LRYTVYFDDRRAFPVPDHLEILSAAAGLRQRARIFVFPEPLGPWRIFMPLEISEISSLSKLRKFLSLNP